MVRQDGAAGRGGGRGCWEHRRTSGGMAPGVVVQEAPFHRVHGGGREDGSEVFLVERGQTQSGWTAQVVGLIPVGGGAEHLGVEGDVGHVGQGHRRGMLLDQGGKGMQFERLGKGQGTGGRGS